MIEAGGSAGIWLARPAALAQERDLAMGMAAARTSSEDAIDMIAVSGAGQSFWT